MTGHIDWLKDYQNASPEQKLQILRNEMSRPIATIKGFANVIKQEIATNDVNELSPEIKGWIEKIIEAGDYLEELLMSMTETPK